MLRVFTNTEFSGVWPVGASAIIIAETPERAAELLNSKLKNMGLKGDTQIENMKEILIDEELVIVLDDGDY